MNAQLAKGAVANDRWLGFDTYVRFILGRVD